MKNMVELSKAVELLDKELKIDEIPDYSGALNGLQLENNGQITKVGAAVDASLPVIKKAIDEGVDFLIVHHGMFWHGAQKLTGAQYQKLKIAMDSNLAIYSAHIPLDIHPRFGNNSLLCDLIGMDKPEPYHDWKGYQLGLKQRLTCSLEELVERTESAVGGAVHFCRGKLDDNVGMVGVITGAAGSEIQTMADAGIHTFITGEGPHWSYSLSEELGVNLIYGGHYATETFGVKCISEFLSDRFSLLNVYIDHPTGL